MRIRRLVAVAFVGIALPTTVCSMLLFRSFSDGYLWKSLEANAVRGGACWDVTEWDGFCEDVPPLEASCDGAMQCNYDGKCTFPGGGGMVEGVLAWRNHCLSTETGGKSTCPGYPAPCYWQILCVYGGNSDCEQSGEDWVCKKKSQWGWDMHQDFHPNGPDC
jgi:hypothetical protein